MEGPQTSLQPRVSCLPGTSLGSVPGGNFSKGVPSARVPTESPVTYRGSITHVSAWGARGEAVPTVPASSVCGVTAWGEPPRPRSCSPPGAGQSTERAASWEVNTEQVTAECPVHHVLEKAWD